MRKDKLFLAVCLVTLAALVALTHVVLADAGSELYSSMWDKGVVVVLYGSQYGTGWWVNKQYLVTAAHVVGWTSNVKVTLIHGDYVATGYVIYTDRVHDIAIIKAEKPPTSQYIFSLAAIAGPEKGQRIFVIGYPNELYKIIGDLRKMSSNPRIAEGIIAWVYPDKQLFEFQAATDAGNSGGPITDENGNVLGIVSFAMRGEVTYLFYGTDVSAIKEALSRVGVKYRVGLSSTLTSTSSTVQPVMIAAVVGGAAAIVTTSLMIPMLRGRR